jgi:hypothetical protein
MGTNTDGAQARIVRDQQLLLSDTACLGLSVAILDAMLLPRKWTDGHAKNCSAMSDVRNLLCWLERVCIELGW